MDSFSLHQRTAVIVGAGGVLARAMAVGLARAGASLALVGRSRERLDAVAEEIDAIGVPVRVYRADASRPDELRTVATAIEADFSSLDILVSAVGGNRPAASTRDTVSFFELPPQALAEVVDLNLMAGAILPAQAFGPALARNPRGGVIINVTSMAALRPLTRIPAYAAAKAAVSNFTQWLAVDLARLHGDRVRVNALAPGFFLTEQNRELLTHPDGSLTDRARTILAHTPMGRFGKPEDLIGPLVWLASDAARFVTGIVVPVDGGFSAFGGV